LATVDPLTRLRNRAYLEERLESIFRLQKSQDAELAAVMIDVDNFKKHNDDPNDLDEIEVLIAPRAGVDFASLKPFVEKQVQNAVFVSAEVKQEKMEKLLEQMGMETELKEKRIIDLRPKS
jgi:hypothetical protein